jgi:hypothetical protein
MLRLLYTCLEIMWFRRGPEDMPGDLRWTVATVAVYAAVGYPLSAISLTPFAAVAQVLVDLLLLVAFVQIVLRWRGLMNRLPQTLTALAGTGVLFTLFALPAMASLDAIGKRGGDASIPALIVIVLLLWNLAGLVHVMRRTLEVTPGRAMWLSLAYFVASFVVMSVIFPPAA